jgi:hypothetical protein
VSGAIPGHGLREDEWTIRPSCKCGWRGRPHGPTGFIEASKSAKAEYERHKDRVRAETPPTPHARKAPPESTVRRLRVVS